MKLGLSLLTQRLDHEWKLEELYRAGKESAIRTEKLLNVLQERYIDANIDELEGVWQRLPLKERKELAITGQNLLEWYQLQGGPWIEEKLLAIEKAIINGELKNERVSIKEWLFTCSQP